MVNINFNFICALKTCHILSVEQIHGGPVCTVLLNSNEFLWSIFQNIIVPPHWFRAGSEASLCFHLQTTSKFIFEMFLFPWNSKSFAAFCEARSSWLSGKHLKSCWCLSASLIGLIDLQKSCFLYLCVLGLVLLEMEGGAWGLRETGLSEMMKFLKKCCLCFLSIMDYWEIFKLM